MVERFGIYGRELELKKREHGRPFGSVLCGKGMFPAFGSGNGRELSGEIKVLRKSFSPFV